MKDAQTPDHVSLTTLIGRLRDGYFVIPDFQREFEWKPWDIRELMRSIFLDYYIGSLLLWKGKSENFEALACTTIHGFEGKADPKHIVLDGQQRLTAMYYAFMAPDIPAPSRQNRFLYFIRVDLFMEEIYDQAFEYDWTRRGVNLLADENLQFEGHLFPLSVVGKGGRALAAWLKGYEEYWKSRVEAATGDGDSVGVSAANCNVANAERFGEYLWTITEQYQVAYIELDRDLELDKVCDIFTQINSRGIRLDIFDLLNALLRPQGLRLKHMWQEAEPRLDFVETERMNVYVLQVMSILLQAYCSPKYLYHLLPGREKKVRESDGSLRKEILVPDVADFERRWSEAVEALCRAIDLLRSPQEFGAISSRYLPYVSILPAFASLQAAVRALPASRRLDAQRKIRHWYWASVFTNRYSGSVESTSARDFLDVKAWLENDGAEPALIGEFEARFKTLDLRSEAKRGSSVYNGIFNLLVLHGARDWMTGIVPQHGDLDDHHIVPQSWGKEHGLGGTIDTILNRTPLSSDTNRNLISERLPNEYLPELIAENGESAVRSILESHFVSPLAFDILLRNSFGADDFDNFIAERQRTLQAAIEDLLVKERLDLPPRLRELDARVETIELALRTVIARAIEGSDQQIPSHVLQKIEERLQAAARKRAALDQDLYQTFGGKLEYADLRDLEDVIMGKSLWPLFEALFTNKETLVKRFDQLAELRNGIRHSRTVDEVTRKEGEAAILWFERVLEG
jgi:hypothetical protein